MNPTIEELNKKIDDLTKKLEEFTNPALISEQFLKTLSDKGFVRIDQILQTPFTTLDEYDSKYFYMFSSINNSRYVFSNINAQDFTQITGVSTSGDTFSASTTGFVTNDAFTFWTTGTVPAPLVNGGTYYVRDITSTSFKLASTIGGAAINITTNGSGRHFLQRINILF